MKDWKHKTGILLLSLSTSLALKGAPTAPSVEFFERKIRPLLAEQCYSCHGPEKQKGKLRLDSTAAIQAGGESGPVLVAGKPDDSRMIEAVRYQNEDLKMPPKTRLNERQVSDLVEWVRLGAPLPPNDSAAPPSLVQTEFQITAKDREHWAFQPVKRPVTPTLKLRGPVANPIDAFILSGLERKGLRSNPPASKRELLRRACYDLTGLPPTPEQVQEFLADKSPGAWEKLIDRLLVSPHYGEKWGRHWLDLVRYAESNSYERDNPKPNAWRYRDYVVRAFNSDKPYDQFIREQLAGDELEQPSDDAIIATGFYRLGIWDDEPADPELARYDGLDDIVTTTGQTFLGLTVDCARCHNHKIDPIPQSDYYRLLSFFQNITPFKNGGPTDELPLRSAPEAKALAVTENNGPPPDTFVLLRGNPKMKGEKVEPAFLRVLGGSPIKSDTTRLGTRTSGRRTALAQWIASPENPLTARVMANRLWQHHFGRGLVRSPNNFGLQGDRSTHPELLDWLASELVGNGWHLKAMHRLIMTSQAYQMSSQGSADALQADPANDLFWRYDMRRLTAEELRDSILAINGSLNLKMGGPGMYVDIPKEVLAGQSRPGNGWGKSTLAEQARRSIYIHVKRSLLTPILETYDVAEVDHSTPVRFVTVQPTQSLGLLNSAFINHEAEAFASRLRREAGHEVGQQVKLALYLATSRMPDSSEVKRGVELLEALQSKDGLSPQTALKYFCLMTLNLNEMIYLD
jgi:hypothetical protein